MDLPNEDTNLTDKETPLAEMQDVTQSFTLETGRSITVLEHIHLAVKQGEILVLTGPSGSGKSTCLRILAGLLVPTTGKVLADGVPFEGINPLVSLVFQNFSLLPWLTVAGNIGLGLEASPLSAKEKEEKIIRVIDLVGLEGFEEAYPKELSGGMKQRVGLARALAMDRPLLCLDEPFSALDVLTAETLRREIVHLWVSNSTAIKSIILVTHNVEEAVSLGSRILVMGTSPGQIRYSVTNKLPYPREEKSPAFKAIVSRVRDVLTQEIIPDLEEEWNAPSLEAESIVAIPPVHVTETIGFLEILAKEGGRIDAFILAKRLRRDSVHVLIMASAAELLGFVDTPKKIIELTEEGWKFVRSHINDRKQKVHDQLLRLKLVQLLLQRLEKELDGMVAKELLLVDIHSWLPNEQPKETLDTLIQWGRYGELIGYNDDTKEVYINRG